MSNLVYDPDFDTDAVIAWARANDLRPHWIPATDVFVEGDSIRFREVVPAPGHEDDEHPDAMPAPTPEDEYAVRVGEWQTVPLKVHPREFGIEVRA